MTMRHLVLPLTAALAACGGDVLPRGAAYQLVRAGHDTLPYELRVEGDCRHLLYGGTVEFDGKGGYTSRYDIRKLCTDSIGTVPQLGATGKFRVEKDTAHFLDETGRKTGHGLLSADSLIVTGPLHTLRYVRSR